MSRAFVEDYYVFYATPHHSLALMAPPYSKYVMCVGCLKMGGCEVEIICNCEDRVRSIQRSRFSLCWLDGASALDYRSYVIIIIFIII